MRHDWTPPSPSCQRPSIETKQFALGEVLSGNGLHVARELARPEGVIETVLECLEFRYLGEAVAGRTAIVD